MHKRTHLVLYGLLFVYIGVSIGQYYHFKNEIEKRSNRIENLNKLLVSHDNQIEKIVDLSSSIIRLEKILDSSIVINENLQSKTLTEITIIKPQNENIKRNDSLLNELTTSETSILPRDSTLVIRDSTILRQNDEIEDKFENNDSIVNELSSKELRELAESFKKYYFNDINEVYANLRNPRQARTKDKSIWIEIDSDYGNYKNPLYKIISRVSLNGTVVNIIDIKENIRNSPTGFKATYFIEISIPRRVLFIGRNQIILTADKDYIKWFSASN